MREYNLKTYDVISWDKVEKAPIDTYRWLDNGYEPVAFAQCAISKNKGLYVRMTCYEKNPLALKKDFCDSVCEDSCLEFFAGFGGEEYVNIEMNSKGVCLATLRTTKEVIAPFDIMIGIPEIKATVNENYWTAEFMLTFEQIKKLFPTAAFQSGTSFRANFYKCGDKTELPHFGMWNEVDCSIFSFHQPDGFGKINIL